MIILEAAMKRWKSQFSEVIPDFVWLCKECQFAQILWTLTSGSILRGFINISFWQSLLGLIHDKRTNWSFIMSKLSKQWGRNSWRQGKKAVGHLDLNVSFGFHFIQESGFQVLPRHDLLIEETHGKIKGVVEGGPDGVLQHEAGLHHVVPT